MKATTNPCTKCRDNFPMPVAMDYFDERVIADYVQRRSACTAVADGEKPCLRVAPASTPASPQRIGMDMVAPFGVYLDGACVAKYATEAQAQQHFDRLRTAKRPTPRICVIYVKDGIEQQSPWFTCRARAEQAKAIIQKRYGACVLYVD